jgi:hypothetical protein
MNLLLKIVVISAPIAIAVLNGANYEGANIMQPDHLDEAVSSVGSLVTALAAYLLLFRR